MARARRKVPTGHDVGPPTGLRHARDGFVPIVGAYVIVGAEDAEPAVARIVAIEIEGAIEVQVLPGRVDEHLALLTATG